MLYTFEIWQQCLEASTGIGSSLVTGNTNDTLFVLGRVEVLKHWLLSFLLKLLC